ncbi:hypothetical protein RI367_001547 [Sorochytrium milnesiophthora]
MSSAQTVAREYARQVMSNNDGSHDFFHVERVRNLAMKIAEKEAATTGTAVDSELVELVAWLHDVNDAKYCADVQEASDKVRSLLRGHLSAERIERVLWTVDHMSYRKELAAQQRGEVIDYPLELRIVQDADRLDAIGAVGVARCFTFSGVKGQALYDPSRPPREHMTAEEYARTASVQHGGNGKGEPTINHFYEKLLKLKDLMKTATGKQMAERRHTFLAQFVDEFMGEMEGKW